MSFYGVVTFIVMMMPEGSIGRNQKIVVIVLVLLTLPFTLLTGYIAARRSNKKAKEKEAVKAAETAAAPAAESQPAKLAAPTGNFAHLNSAAEETIQFLKSSSLGEGGKDAVYSLPWYFVAGGPKSGKSSLVIGSNLNFQTLPSQRQSEMKFVKPTANVDFRVTSDAVFIDTAGRYLTEGVDSEEWSALLETIKKYRSNRPIDGFLLVVNAETIMRSDDRQNEELAKVYRARLDEAMQRLRVRFPVYLVFTNADSIEGFRDSFSSSKNEDKILVWGATIPLEKSENAQALFDGEYELLHNSLMKRRLVRLSAPFAPVRQLRIFNFPLHFGSARRRFGAFVNALFRPNPFSDNPFLRGFYFTAVPAAKASQNAPKTAANTYFTERLIRDVVLRDKDLVKTFMAQRQRAPIFGWFMTLLGAGIVFLLLAMSGVSLITNRQMLADATEVGERGLELRKADTNKDVLAKKEEEVRQEIRVLDNMRPILTTLDDNERNGAPIYMRFGLYSGDAIYLNNLLPIYFNLVEKRFKEPVVRRLEEELKKFADGKETYVPGRLSPEDEQKLDRAYNLLKAYLMISGGSQKIGDKEVRYPDKAESTHIVNTLKEFWSTESKVPVDMRPTADLHLEFWAKQVDRSGTRGAFPRIDLNARLVEDTRRKLQAFPAINRYYSNQITRISKEVDENIGPMTVEGILGRNSADSSLLIGSHRVPGAFTASGLGLMKKAIDESSEKLAEDDWVMGELGKRELVQAQATDAKKLEDFYYRDYSDQWRRFVKGVQLQPLKARTDAVDAFEKFSSPNSPIVILVREIERNVNLTAAAEGGGLLDYIFSFFSKKQGEEQGNTQPEKDFRPLFNFVGKPDDEKAPIESYRAQLSLVHRRLSTLTDDRFRNAIEQMAKEGDPLELVKSEQNIMGLLSGFSETAAGPDLSNLLLQPLGTLRTLLGAGIKQQIERGWTQELVPASKEIETGYPFQDGSTEVDMGKLASYLNPAKGRFTTFFNERVAKYFEESGGQWKPRETSEVQFTDEFVAYVNNAIRLQKALFGTSETPKFDYEFNLRPVKDATVEVSIDGQKVTSEGTGSIRGSFPAGPSAQTGVFVNLLSTSGTTSGANTSGGDTSGSASSSPYQGTWGLFRFVDASQPQKQEGGEYLLTFKVGGKTVNATIKSSGGDVFDRSMFRQLKAPQAILK